MTASTKAILIDSLCKKEPDTTIIEYLEIVAELEGIDKATMKFKPEPPPIYIAPILKFTYPIKQHEKVQIHHNKASRQRDVQRQAGLPDIPKPQPIRRADRSPILLQAVEGIRLFFNA